jgi:hypothetical protein
MAGRDGLEPPTSSSRGKRSAAELPAYGGEARDRTENRWNQNPLLCQLSYLPTWHKPWIPAADLNRALLITKQVRRHLRLQGTEPIPGLEPGFLNYKSSASPPTLDRRKQRRRLTIGRTRAEAQVRDSNPHFRQLGAARRLRSGNLDVGNVALCQLSYGRKLMERSPGVQPG